MGAPGPLMQDVVLVDDGVDGAPATGDRRPPRGPSLSPSLSRRSPRRRAPSWWPVAAGLAVVVAASTAVADRRERARLAALADVPGILAPLDGQVGERWRVEGARFSELAAVAGRLVGVENHPDGGVDVVALDPGSGLVRWRVAARPAGAPDTRARCAWPDQRRAAGSGGAVAAPALACVVVDEAASHENAAGGWPHATGARLLVLDVTTGAVLADTPTDPSTSIAALGADLVTSRVDSAGRVHVTRSDVFGTDERWTFTSPGPLPTNPAGRQQARVTVRDDLVIVTAGSGWVLTGDGSVVRSWTSDPTSWDGGRVDVQGGGRLLVETGTAEAGASGSHLVDLATGRSFTDPGYAIGPTPDDGSLRDLVLTQSARGADLVAHNLASGRPWWTAPGSDGAGAATRARAAIGGLVVLDRRVVRAEADRVRSVDGRTGRTVWSAPTAGPAQGALFSDGRVVLRAHTEPGLGLVVAAYGLTDGTLVWRADLADDLFLVAIGGRLYGTSERALVALS